MEMELIGILKVLRRWWWLLALFLIATAGALFLYFQSIEDIYMAEVTINVIRPDSEDIEVFDERNYTETRIEIINSLNKFVDVIEYPEVRQRTLTELNITEDYVIDTETRAGADFVFLQVFASTPELARDIANVHAEHSIKRYGEIRANSLNEAVLFFEDEVSIAKQELADAEQALTDFRLEHGIVSVSEELDIGRRVLERLNVIQAQTEFNSAVTEITQSVLEAILGASDDESGTNAEDIDNLINVQRQDLSALVILEPEYQLLVDTINTARDKYSIVTEKLVEAELRQSFASQAFFVQIIQEADLPSSSENDTLRILVFAISTSLGLAISLALILDNLLGRGRVS